MQTENEAGKLKYYAQQVHQDAAGHIINENDFFKTMPR
jgi:hypothetical protein